MIGVAFINFSIPSTLKSSIDHIGRAGKTFLYTATGPEGLATGKKAYIVLASGSIYSTDPMAVLDHASPYLRAEFGFIGITDVELIRVEGVNQDPDGAKTAIVVAWQRIARLAT